MQMKSSGGDTREMLKNAGGPAGDNEKDWFTDTCTDGQYTFRQMPAMFDLQGWNRN